MILASILALWVATAPSGESTAAPPAATERAPAPDRSTFAPLRSELRDPFAHVPRRAPTPPTAPPTDLKDPFKKSPAPRREGARAEAAAPPPGDLIDPFTTAGGPAELPSGALKDPFTQYEVRAAAPASTRPLAPLQRPAQGKPRRSAAEGTPTPTILPPSQ